MKRLVNGKEADLKLSKANVRTLGDRLVVSTKAGSFTAVAIKKGDTTLVSYRGRQYAIEPIKAARATAGKDHSGSLISPMPGAVVDVLVEAGQTVEKGDKVVILEAMKTQQTFLAPFKGKIARLTVSKGDQVGEGVVMAVVERDEDQDL
jgi:3-methylcrotonyl-CoA carboxylase alpha subunit